MVEVLTESPDAGAYWRKLKKRSKKEGNETVTICHGLKMVATDEKMRLTDVADTEQLSRLIQSVPSPKVEPFKQWLTRVGSERIDEIEGPEKGIDRLMEATTTEISKENNPEGFEESRAVGSRAKPERLSRQKQGGKLLLDRTQTRFRKRKTKN